MDAMAKPPVLPTVGDIVQFHFDHGVRVTRPALVVELVPDADGEPEGRLDLHVFLRKGDEWATPTLAVAYADDRGVDPRTLPKKDRVQAATWSFKVSAEELLEAQRARKKREAAERVQRLEAELRAAHEAADR